MADFLQETLSLNKEVKLAGDSIWMDTKGMSVNVTEISIRVGDEDEPDNDCISVYVTHDGPYEIYTDSGFEKEISEITKYDLGFSEQGMQDDGLAHLEGYVE
jgi:hypothetical protein